MYLFEGICKKPHQRPRQITEALHQLEEQGEVRQVHIEDWEPSPQYVLNANLTHAAETHPLGIHILSPFDNLVIDRRRLGKLFGFDYRLECYLPASKRRYGYFSLPILDGEHFLGRLDAKADRKQKTLIVRHLGFEADVRFADALLSALADRLWEFACFNRCERVVLEEVNPVSIEEVLERAFPA